MKKIGLIIGCFLCLMSTAYSQKQLTLKKFQKQCNSLGLVFEMPKGYERIDVKQNRDLGYIFAIINSDKTMEIRYTLTALASFVKNYEESLEDSTRSSIDPNALYKSMVMASTMNVTGGKLHKRHPFPTGSVNADFNADAGGTCYFQFKSDFGKGYKYGQFVYLHKDNLSDALITFMSNDANTHAELMKVGFYALKFKK